MTIDYQKVWNSLNELEMVTAKICSAREILDSAVDRLQEHQYDKAETLLYAADEFLQYYLEDFDRKFKLAWKETVTKINQETIKIDDLRRSWDPPEMWDRLDDCRNVAPSATQRDIDDYSIEYKGSTVSSVKQDKVVKWQLPVEEGTDCITGEQEYFITFPDDLLEAANLKRGDDVEWVDRGDGSFLLRKTTQPKTYDEMVAAGYTVTADGFWIKEN
jgi:hypothetical protein